MFLKELISGNPVFFEPFCPIYLISIGKSGKNDSLNVHVYFNHVDSYLKNTYVFFMTGKMMYTPRKDRKKFKADKNAERLFVLFHMFLPIYLISIGKSGKKWFFECLDCDFQSF